MHSHIILSNVKGALDLKNYVHVVGTLNLLRCEYERQLTRAWLQTHPVEGQKWGIFRLLPSWTHFMVLWYSKVLSSESGLSGVRSRISLAFEWDHLQLHTTPWRQKTWQFTFFNFSIFYCIFPIKISSKFFQKISKSAVLSLFKAVWLPSERRSGGFCWGIRARSSSH